MKILSRASAIALLGTTLLSCGGEPTAPVPVLTTLTVSFAAGSVFVGQSATATTSGVDQFGAAIGTGTITWSSSSTGIATVSSSGVVTGVAPGQTQVTATSGGKQGQASVTVIPVPVAALIMSPLTATLLVTATQQLTATPVDASNNPLVGRPVTWATSDLTKATVSTTGLVTAVAAGAATITATSEGKSGSAQITVSAPQSGCTPASALQLAVGGIHALTTAEKASLCLGEGASASEYALIPFNSTNVAASTIQFQISATNTLQILPGSLASLHPAQVSAIGLKRRASAKSFESDFRERERRDLASPFGLVRRSRQTRSGNTYRPSNLTSIPANPVVGSIVDINTNITGNTCTSPKQLHGALVVAVLPHTIVLSDTLSPSGGFTTAEMIGFGQSFDTLVYALDVSNFGAPTDLDGDSRIAILFTPGVNVVPAPPGAVVGGLFAARDLFPVANCVASNEGEMFYMPVPDPNKTINANYASKSNVASDVVPTLGHEFQHLINAGRRIYVNNASSLEEVWLNEGLSHIAEELLYYRISANLPRSNIDLSLLQSSQAQVDAINTYQINNLGRLTSYLNSPEVNSPFSQVDGLEMRGAIWQLLRYSADKKGGSEQSTWFALVNSITAGQTNFNAVFGDLITNSRDWAVAQFVDDASLNAAAIYANPSWNFRSVLPAINSGNFPLLTRPLLNVPVNVTLNGGGAAYIRFRVAANVPASIGAVSSGQPVSSAVDFILVRTQ